MGIFPSNFPQQQQIGLKVSGFYIIWRLLRGRVFLYGRASRHIGSCCFDFLLTKEHSHRNEKNSHYDEKLFSLL